MLKKHSQFFLSLLYLMDMAFSCGAWVLAYYIRFESGLMYDAPQPLPLSHFLPVLPFVIAANSGAALLVRLYRPRRYTPLRTEFFEIVKACSLAWLALLASVYFYQGFRYSRKLLLLFLVLNPLAMILAHGIGREFLRVLRRRGWNQRWVALVGDPQMTDKLHYKIRHTPWTGMQVGYFVHDDPKEIGKQRYGLPVLGPFEQLDQIVRTHPVDAIFLTFPLEQFARLPAILRALMNVPTDVRLVPDLMGTFTVNASVGDFDGLPVLSLRESPIQGWSAVLKRAFDLVGSLVLILLFGVPMLIIALLVKLTSHGPVFYVQRRVGLDGRAFPMIKFRSMRVDAEAQGGAVWATRDDPRRTPIGTLLRGTSLDELPQLFNVLVGQMSLVGPRPERPEFLEPFQSRIPTFVQRLKVKAGMTGWAQVNGLRGDTSLEKRIEYDLHYINNWSLWFDIRILAMTLVHGFVHEHAH